MCARLNLIVAGPGEQDRIARQQRALDSIATPNDIARINNAANKHRDKLVTIFFRGQLQELMRWIARYCIDLPGDGHTFKDPAVRHQFFKAVLIASQLWHRRRFTEAFHLKDGVESARLRNLGTIRRGFEDATVAPDFSISLGRGWKLFSEYFPRRYPEFTDEFRAATGLSPQEYYICIAQIIADFVLPYTNDPEKPPFFTTQSAAATPYSQIFPRYVQLESQTADELAASLWDEVRFPGVRSLRERPILRTANNRGIILDQVFYSERASVGPLFHLLPKGNANRIFGAFGLAVEDYVADILRRMHPDGNVLVCNVSGRTPSGQTLEIDAVLRQGADLAVFETKAAWLQEEKVGGDHKKYLDEIRTKYGVVDKSNPTDRVKGVGQLARIIKEITESWQGPSNEFAATTTIYPILLVHDSLLGVPVYTNFLAREFSKLLTAGDIIQELHIGGKRILPLTVMTIADLENLEQSIRAFSLFDLLADYSAGVPDRVRSLHNFIAVSKYGTMMYKNKHLAESTLDLFTQCRAMIFPNLPPLED